MRRTSTTCSPSWRSAGLTLIEVTAALAILGTLLVGVVVAKARHTRQLHDARRMEAVVKAADELIAGWWISPDGVPEEAAGSMPGDAALSWTTRIVENAELQEIGVRVVRLELRAAPSIRRGDDQADEPILAVDLPLRVPEPLPVDSEASPSRSDRSARKPPAKAGQSTDKSRPKMNRPSLLHPPRTPDGKGRP